MAGTGPQPACPAGSAALEGWVGGAGGRCGEGHWGGGGIIRGQVRGGEGGCGGKGGSCGVRRHSFTLPCPAFFAPPAFITRPLLPLPPHLGQPHAAGAGG